MQTRFCNSLSSVSTRSRDQFLAVQRLNSIRTIVLSSTRLQKMEQKLDAILTVIDTFSARIHALESKVDSLDKKFNYISEELQEQKKLIIDLETKVEAKVSKEDYYELLARVESLEKQDLNREAYSKRMNLLIHGLDEKVWETKAETRNILTKFMDDGLKIDSSKISVLDIHRLPQHPITKHGKKVARPIIIKVASSHDKYLIMSNLGNLKAYNESQKLKANESTESCDLQIRKTPVFITEHLPKQFYNQKKRLMPKFKEARQAGQKTSWSISDGSYCLFIDGKKHMY